MKRRELVGAALGLPLFVGAAEPGVTLEGVVARVDGGDLVLQAPAVVRRHPVATLDGRQRGKVAQVVAVAARRSFVVALDGVDELWEVSVDPQAAPIFDGLVHDHRMGEALPKAGFLGARRTPLDGPLQVLAVDGASGFVLAQRLDAPAPTLQVLHLDARQRIARIPLPPGLRATDARLARRANGRPAWRLPAQDDGPDGWLDLRAPRAVERVDDQPR